MAKYFINGIEYANLSTARSEAKKLSKDGETVVIKNADATDKAWYQGGVEIDIVTDESVVEEENVTDEVTQDYATDTPTEDDTHEEAVNDNIKYRVFLIDKLTGTKSCLVSPPAVGGYFSSEEEATKSAQNFITLTKLANRFSFTVVSEERK